MKGNDGSDEARKVDDKHLVVRRSSEAPSHDVASIPIAALTSSAGAGRACQAARKQVKDVLEVVKDLVVDGQLARDDLGEVRPDVDEASVEALEGRQLSGDAGGEGARRRERKSNVSEEVLDTNLLSLFSLDRRRDVGEGPGRGRAILMTRHKGQRTSKAT